MMTANDSAGRIPATDVFRRYQVGDLPAFCGIALEDGNQVTHFGERPLEVTSGVGTVGTLRRSQPWLRRRALRMSANYGNR